MIYIRKPSTPPSILTNEGAAEKTNHCNAYSLDEAAYKNGQKTFTFDNKSYGHESVRDELKKAQHGKCAFCESRITHVQFGDVEHFRPKAGVSRGKKLIRPGYYWLAYDWDNLLLACQLCNQRHKRNAFPLLRGSPRARSHNDAIATEQYVFIHPAKEDPENLIGFRGHVPHARKGSLRGRQTIKELGLKREELMSVRANFLARIRLLHEAAQELAPGPTRTAIEKHLHDAMQDSAPFSAMVRCFLASI